MQNDMIRAVIVDDEEHNRNILVTMLAEYCVHVKVTGIAANADEAFNLICEEKPDLVFLDIKMPGKSGFDLLRMFDEFKFEVIFVSAFNEYAVHAFDFNAVDYILKPIDYAKLIKSVTKASHRIISNEPKDTLHFIRSLDEVTSVIKKFPVHYRGKVILVNVAEVISIEAHSEYCLILLENGSHYTSYKSLKEFDDVLRPLKSFVRLNKSVLVNMEFIRSYTKGELCIVEMTKDVEYEVSRRKKTEILNLLKLYMENKS
jgi:two-component system, LytTR family, response regulator